MTAGSGPRECEIAARGITLAYVKEAKAFGLSASILSTENNRSHLLKLEGDHLDAFLKDRCGTVKWICHSPLRKNHKRKTWFVGITRLPQPDQIPDLNVKDVTFTAVRANGPGGQHVNKTNSAVRAVHNPTGLSVSAQEERSQHSNKKICLIKLAALFSLQRNDKLAKDQEAIWKTHKALERGNPVRVYRGIKFKLCC